MSNGRYCVTCKHYRYNGPYGAWVSAARPGPEHQCWIIGRNNPVTGEFEPSDCEEERKVVVGRCGPVGKHWEQK